MVFGVFGCCLVEVYCFWGMIVLWVGIIDVCGGYGDVGVE